jgi:hypothetical protein
MEKHGYEQGAICKIFEVGRHRCREQAGGKFHVEGAH